MSRLTDFLKLHIWEIPKDNNEKFNYTKAIADNFDKIDEGMKNAVSKFTEPLSYKGSVLNYENLPVINTNGDIYTVTSENKNYIWNGTTWEEYSSNIDLTPIEEQLKTTQTTDIAEELSIPNTAPVNGKLDIKSGKSEQKTRSGKNKIKIPDMTYTNGGLTYTVKDGIINVSGTREGESTLVINNINCILPAGTYTLSTNASNYPYVTLYSNDVTIVQTASSDVGVKTFTLEKETVITRARCYLNISNYPNIIKLQIEEGTAKTEFEQYGAMPSPDYPSDIRNVGDNINLLENTATTQTKNGITFTVNTDGTVLVNGTATGDTELLVQKATKFQKGDYILSDDINSSNATYFTRIYSGSSGYTTVAQTVNETSKKFTLTEKTILRTVILIKNGVTVNNLVFKPKIEQGSIATSYSKYGCGSVGFKVENKNLATIEVGSISTNNGQDTSSNSYYKTNFINTMNNKTFSSSYETNSSKPQIVIFEYDINKNFLRFTYVDALKFTTTIGEDTKYIRARYKLDSSSNTMNNVIVNVGQQTDYVEHQEQTVVFPLSQGQLLHKGDYLAQDGIHQVRGVLILNGYENWVKSSNTNNNIFLVQAIFSGIINTSLFDTSISNYFTHKVVWDIDEIGFEIYNNSNIRFGLGLNSEITTLEQWKTFLQEQYANGTPVIVEYELAKETITPYTEEQKEAYYQLQHLLMYEGYTSIECIDEIKPDIQVEYSYNNEINTTYGKKIDTLEARIRQLEKMITSQSEVVE